MTSSIDSKTAERFWSKVSISGPDDCWEWTAYRSASGYGQLAVDGKAKKAHRVAYEIANGPIEPGMFVCHHCDNPPCCNPAHLFSGTPADNCHDMLKKGRHVRPERDESAVNYCCGEDSNFSKLTEAAVRDIRSRKKAGERTNDLANEYGVDRTLIWQITTRRAWKHVE